jgi:hypothetical protein
MLQTLNKAAVAPVSFAVRSGGSPAPGGQFASICQSRLRFSHQFLYDWKLWLMLFFLAQLSAVVAVAQPSREYQLKAVFLWRLAQFTQWPANAFDQPDSPIVIGVLGENPFDGALEAAVRGETAQGRKLVIQHYRSPDEIKTCHILFINGPVARQVKEITAAVAGRSILTVRDAEGLPRAYEPMIRFVTEQNKIKLRIDLKAVTAARLVLDPRLLRAADVIGSD